MNTKPTQQPPNEMQQFVLREQVSGKLFQKMTMIGPMLTDDPDKAERFSSKQDAYRSPAFSHMLCIFEAEEVK